MSEEKKSGNLIAIITMFALYGMVGFVTNLAAPLGDVWKAQPGINGSNALGMMGNTMNFLAYLLMGIPAGRMILKFGYKTTALIAIACGFGGILVQWLSGVVLKGATCAGVPANFFVYLAGAFICGFCVCMLNTVVNPMLNTVGGGGKRGNQLNMAGSSINSLAGTAAPIVLGALIGEALKKLEAAKLAGTTADVSVSDVSLVMYIAMAIFAAAFIVIAFLPFGDAGRESLSNEAVPTFSPLRFRHCLLGVIGIFCYMGIELGIPSMLFFWLKDGPLAELAKTTPGLVPAAVAGSVVGTYWFLMLVGRLVGSSIGGKVSSKTLLVCTTGGGLLLVGFGVMLTKVNVMMPVFTGNSSSVSSIFALQQVPLTALLFVLGGLCTSIMWACTFNLAVEGLGKYTAPASGLFMTMVVGGAVFPLIQSFIADHCGYMASYVVPGFCLAYLFSYALFFSKNVNTDIKVD